jgi:hypothetical protein
MPFLRQPKLAFNQTAWQLVNHPNEYMSSPLVAILFDHMHNNRLGFIRKGAFFILAGLTYLKFHLNWNERHGKPPVPHAG